MPLNEREIVLMRVRTHLPFVLAGPFCLGVTRGVECPSRHTKRDDN